jgi:hypothetical protein
MRVAAVGDLHGDWHKAIESFRAAGVITVTDEDEVVWSGGDTVVVQLGDVLDRGDHEIGVHTTDIETHGHNTCHLHDLFDVYVRLVLNACLVQHPFNVCLFN